MGAAFEHGFSGRVAVVTGGGAGMGRELVRQLAADGCDVATCDVMEDKLAETVAACAADGSKGEVMTMTADVSDEGSVLAFRDAVADWRPHVNLLFNNAGIGGGGSIVTTSRENWERTFGVCWYGVYYGTRAFLPLMMKADAGHVVNTSSVNGFWASIGPAIAHTAYSAAKFAVRGFTEALIVDFRLHAPHLRASVVMPGHIGTDIAVNTSLIHGVVDPVNDPERAARLQARGETFKTNAPMTAAEAASVILDGVRQGRWRILVGQDAHLIDEMIRAAPEAAYEPEFYDEWVQGTAELYAGRIEDPKRRFA
jgi:NAD(P)-dependent dehydrogenase (short-subunit alcohol dehydrogenase family)